MTFANLKGEASRLDRLIAKYGGRVPRYTSYPTAVQFSSAVGESDFRRWLRALRRADGAISLYLHIPFCAQLCWYCGCHTKVVNAHAPVADYVTDLLTEIDRVADAVSDRLEVASVHFGGGTPNMLSPHELAIVLARIAKKFDLRSDADIAVEIDPRLLTRDWALGAAREGVTRASLGVQDFNPQVQAAIHRVQSFETVARARDALREAGIASINLDLMYGLPRQTLGSLEATTAQAIELAPDRLSLFGYAHVPWMKQHQALIKESELPDARTRLLMQRHAAMDFEAAGFQRLGLDHFARREDALAEASAEHRMRRNFQGYTHDAADVVLGFGASAISRLPQGYAQNIADTREWRERIEKGRLPVARGVVLDEEDRFRAALIERLMCDFFVDVAEVAERHAWPLAEFDIDCKRLAEMEMYGLVYLSDGTVSVTEDGRDFVRSIAAVFDRYLERGEGVKHAQGV